MSHVVGEKKLSKRSFRSHTYTQCRDLILCHHDNKLDMDALELIINLCANLLYAFTLQFTSFMCQVSMYSCDSEKNLNEMKLTYFCISFK